MRARLFARLKTLPVDCSKEDVGRQLDKLFDWDTDTSDAPSEVVAPDDNDDNITPLMLICDAGNSVCLRYIQSEMERCHDDDDDDDDDAQDSDRLPWLLNVWGKPLDQSRHGNTALHHAFMSGMPEALGILSSILRMDTPDGKKPTTMQETNWTLLIQTNRNGDTPLMMASVGGHLSILQQVRSCVGSDEHWIELLIGQKNDKDECCITLLVGHGHSHMVSWLLAKDGGGGLDVSYELVQQCQRKVATMNRAVEVFRRQQQQEGGKTGTNQRQQQQQQQQRQRQQQKRQQQVKKCLVILQVALAQQSEQQMKQLLKEEEEEQDKNSTGTSNKKEKRGRHKKHKKGPKPTATQQEKAQADTDDSIDDDDKNDSVWEGPAEKGNAVANTVVSAATTPNVCTMQDGTVVVKQPSLRQSENIAVVDNSQQLQKSMDSKKDTLGVTSDGPRNNDDNDDDGMLRQRLLESGNLYTDDTALDSLCLDASMLLWKPHRMALELSGSQLEAIGVVLRHQWKAVQTAQNIQERLRRGANP